MRRLLFVALVAALAVVLWTGTIVAGVLEGWWRPPLAPHGDIHAFAKAAVATIDREHKGNVAFVLLKDGKVYEEHFVSIGKPVSADTLFQVASLSKWITAWGVMRLVQSGRLELDAPVSKYLKRWHLPPSKFDNNKVTIRRLLSHTAGLTDGLGYAGFAPGHTIQSLPASLTAAADASPGADGHVRVGMEPGSQWKYSGGGFTLLQLVIEDRTGQPFNTYMKEAVLQPLGMTHSTFVLSPSDAANVAVFYDTDGRPAVHYHFTAKAAASLYTCASDLTRFLQGQVPGPNGEAGRGVLRPATLHMMWHPEAFQYGAAIWGLGTILYADNNAGGFVIGHDGNNSPAINTAARIDPASRDGIVVLETGNPLLATQIAGEWVFWQTGNVDLFMVITDLRQKSMLIAGGWLVILLATLFTGWRVWPRRSSKSV